VLNQTRVGEIRSEGRFAGSLHRKTIPGGIQMSVQEKLSGTGGPENMPLFGRLKADLKEAMKNRDDTKRSAIRQVMAEYPALTVPIQLADGKKTTRPKKPEEITDEDIQGIIRKLVKSEKMVMAAKGETSSGYVAVLESYLPRLTSRAEIRAWIKANVDFSSFQSPMQAMGVIMNHFGKSADGGEVKSVLQEMVG
jgi:uncharacterized protein